MADAQVPGLITRRKKTGYKTVKEGFFRKDKYVDIWEELEPAWPVGMHMWDGGWSRGFDNGATIKGVRPIGVTISGKIVVMDPPSVYVADRDYDHLPFPDESGNYEKRLLDGTRAFEEIRVNLEEIAQKYNMKLDVWEWPPKRKRGVKTSS